jgi:predicted RNase H-like nuclease (RuvC/YqgF family)
MGEFITLIYENYLKSKDDLLLEYQKRTKDLEEELNKIKRDNEELNDKLAKIYLNSKKSIDSQIDKDTMISEAIDKMDELRPRFETDIRLAQSGELNKEILKNRRELFRERKTEYMKIKSKLEAAGIHDIDARISDFDALIWSSQKALGISADKDDKNSIIFLKGEKKSPYIEDGRDELKQDINKQRGVLRSGSGVKVLSFGEGGDHESL